jgi:threonine aldolase
MRTAMSNAELGDDGWNEDPTVNHLQERAAELMGKEAALFVASGTMGNLVSLLAHCRRGEQVIAGSGCHIVNLEENGAATLGGIGIRTIANQPDGTMKLNEIESAVSPHNGTGAKLICLENTWNGQPLSSEYMQGVRHIADRHGLRMHLDGARLFNAAVALHVSALELVRAADSVQFCLAKGLAAPAGSMICGDKSFIQEAKRIRKMVGGGMRQIGMLAAAGLVALETMRERLQEDHVTAKSLAIGLQSMECFKLDANETKTNIVFFDTASDAISRQDLANMLKEAGVLVAVDPRMGIRAVTHYGITESDIEEALERVRVIAAGKMLRPASTC